MPATRRQPAPDQPRRRPRDAVERLYVYWIVSTVLLALVVLLIATLAHAAAGMHNEAIRQLSQRMDAFEEQLRTLQSESPIPGTPSATHPAAHLVPAPTAATPSPVTQPTSPPPVLKFPAEESVAARLNAVLPADARGPADITDRSAATALVESSMEYVRRAPWSGGTWARLAVLSRLLGRSAAAEAYAQRARAAGDPAVRYAELSARHFLASGQAQEALPHASDLAAQTNSAPTARLLLALALFRTSQLARADEIVTTLDPAQVPADDDRLALARLLLSLERWDGLAAALKTVPKPPDGLLTEYNFLTATSLARSGRAAEALAILDWLAGELRRGPAPAGESTWALAGPDVYEVEVWRGVALTLAGRTEAARQALLRTAKLRPGDAGAHYYLGVLEARAGRPEIAMSYLKNAVATSQRMAPAWEAMALLEIDAGRIEPALEHLKQALEINPRRASARFLAAIAHAKLSEAGPTVEALRSAFRLDPRYLDQARQAEVILRLLTPGELEALAAEAAGHAAPGQEPQRSRM